MDIDLVVGAGSGIGGALIERWAATGKRPIIAVARPNSAPPSTLSATSVQFDDCDYSDQALNALAETLRSQGADIVRLVICNGVLQGEGLSLIHI